ncbi:MFS transporter [Longispora sp. NPDC051575]|uniref:MDR family MFS transporter n=1 Tax=Longispora sp. NPDC051575 TaxID=3154943 RepID=UPI00342A9F76
MRGWWQQTAGGLPRTFWYLWTGTLINRAGAFVGFLLTFYLHDTLKLDAQFIGLVIGLIGAGGAAGVLIGGQLADRWGRRSTLLTANVATSALILALGFVDDRWSILVVGTLMGVAQNMSRPAFSAMMVDIVPDKDRVRAFSLNYWVLNAGFSISALLGGLLADFNPVMIFAVNAATNLATAFVVFFRVPETRPDLPAVPAVDAAPAGVNPFRDRAFLGMMALTFLTSMVFMQHLSSLPLIMQGEGLTSIDFGLVIALNGILIVAGQLFIPLLVRGRDPSWVLGLGSLVMGVGFGLTAFAHGGLGLYALTVVIWTLGEMIQSPSNSELIARLSPAAARGRYQGGFSLSFSAAAFAAPLIGGFVIQHLGGAWLWWGCLVVGVVGAVANVLLAKSRNRRVAELYALENGGVAAKVAA